MRAALAVGGGRQRLERRGFAGLSMLTLTSRLHSVSTDFPGRLSTPAPSPFWVTGFRVAAEQDIHIDHVGTARGHRSRSLTFDLHSVSGCFGVRYPQPVR